MDQGFIKAQVKEESTQVPKQNGSTSASPIVNGVNDHVNPGQDSAHTNSTLEENGSSRSGQGENGSTPPPAADEAVKRVPVAADDQDKRNGDVPVPADVGNLDKPGNDQEPEPEQPSEHLQPQAQTGSGNNESQSEGFEDDEDYDDEDDSNVRRPKRSRTAYSGYQLDQLEYVFAQTHYPDVLVRQNISNQLNIQEAKLQVWFQNRRARWRKQQRTGCVSSRSRTRKRPGSALAPVPGIIPGPSNGGAQLVAAPWMVAQTMQGSSLPIQSLPYAGAQCSNSSYPLPPATESYPHHPLQPINTSTVAGPVTQTFTPNLPSPAQHGPSLGFSISPGNVPYSQLVNFPTMMSMTPPQHMNQNGQDQPLPPYPIFQSCAVHDN